MTDHITAAELRGKAESWRIIGLRPAGDVIDRAAAALDALNARIAELERVAAATSDFNAPQHQADAELGALVRRWRDYPGKPHRLIDEVALQPETLRNILAHLDWLAASCVAEQGVEGPSGDRFRWKDGRVEVKSRRGDVWVEGRVCFISDIPTVAALIKRHGGGE
jgi:hypothetical protein